MQGLAVWLGKPCCLTQAKEPGGATLEKPTGRRARCVGAMKPPGTSVYRRTAILQNSLSKLKPSKFYGFGNPQQRPGAAIKVPSITQPSLALLCWP